MVNDGTHLFGTDVCRQTVVRVIIGLGICQSAWAETPAQLGTTRKPQPIVTRQAIFSIPFYLNANTSPPEEVQLYVSGDKGLTWSLYQRRRADQSKFDFQAGEDGEYWFVVRTNQDQNAPSESTDAEKVVVVDRQAPQLQLSVRLGDSGQLVASWEVTDPHLDPRSTRLQYRLAGATKWQPVSVDLPLEGDPPTVPFRGEASWTVVPQDGVVDVRFEIFDRAGNRAELVEHVPLSPKSSPDAKASPTASSDSSTSTTTSTISSERKLPWIGGEGDPMPAEEGPAASTWRRSPSPLGTRDDPFAARGVLAGEDPKPSPSREPVLSTGTNSGPFSLSSSNHDSIAPIVEAGDSPSDSPDSGSSGFRPDSERRPTTRPTRLPPSPADCQLSNSRRFELDYDLEGVGPSGAARVELWYTQDDGRSWQPYGIDNDLTSPFAVELPREGTYGFRLLIHGHQGQSARAPQSGDAADLCVSLDWTPPEATFVSTTLTSTPEGPVLEARWQATDDDLAERPIRLSYGPTRQGPWSIWVDSLPNDGVYRETVRAPLPTRVYLRLEVTDRAGNVAAVQSLDPLSPRGSEPRGVIRRLRPIANASSDPGQLSPNNSQ